MPAGMNAWLCSCPKFFRFFSTSFLTHLAGHFLTEISAKIPFSAKMTGSKMLLVIGHFVVNLRGTAKNILIDFLGNGHSGVF